MCECKENNWCRSWEETQYGRFPIDNHHPDCSEHKKKEYKVISFDGSRCIVTPEELNDYTDNLDSENESYHVDTVYITEYQFNKIPEFAGW